MPRSAARSHLESDRRRSSWRASASRFWDGDAPQLRLVNAWLDTCTGIGLIVGGKARQGYDRQLTRYDGQGWRATLYTSEMEHSPTSASGTAWQHTSWRAVQETACETLRRELSTAPGLYFTG